MKVESLSFRLHSTIIDLKGKFWYLVSFSRTTSSWYELLAALFYNPLYNDL